MWSHDTQLYYIYYILLCVGVRKLTPAINTKQKAPRRSSTKKKPGEVFQIFFLFQEQ